MAHRFFRCATWTFSGLLILSPLLLQPQQSYGNSKEASATQPVGSEVDSLLRIESPRQISEKLEAISDSASIYHPAYVSFRPLTDRDVSVGAERFNLYLPLLRNKRVGIFCNHSSLVGERHLIDTLHGLGVDIVRIFTPEHGFDGMSDAGKHVQDSRERRYNIPIISLYGKHKSPTAAEMQGVDIMLFDIQDVGVRCYTYISSMHMMMGACAKMQVPLIVLDRPNPNGYWVGGPVLEEGFESFVGMHSVAWVHGMTIGEFANMINEEGWLGDSLSCDLSVIPCEGWTHSDAFVPPVAPSPNLRTYSAILLYPSLALFEGTPMSVGRGTDLPFELVGSPDLKGEFDFAFTPSAHIGASKPLYDEQTCYGFYAGRTPLDTLILAPRIRWEWIEMMRNAYQREASAKDPPFFKGFFNQLTGTQKVREAFEKDSADQIDSILSHQLNQFRVLRHKYLLYPDSERERTAYQKILRSLTH